MAEADQTSGPPFATRVYLDLTHLGRHVTGLERISIELFERAAFRGADVRPIRAHGVISMILRQQILLPLLALLNPRAMFVFPGFPPSPLFILARRRVVMYVHDLFLITRRQDLGLKARLYMAWPFRLAVTHLRSFLTNSEKTRTELVPFAAADAEIDLYRPTVRNVFDLVPRTTPPDQPMEALRLVTLGTVEPRKNYAAAAAIVDALAARGWTDVRLDIIGREGWGNATALLRDNPRIRLRGYLSAAEAKATIEDADLYLCTSHDEGLGLPLLEVQFAGLAVAAPDAPVFREVLGQSGIFIDPADPDAAAATIAKRLSTSGRRDAAVASLSNVARWNAAAQRDADHVLGRFDRRMAASAPPSGRRTVVS